jgi:glycosyltransferase involved in cell wall biosynthesis
VFQKANVAVKTMLDDRSAAESQEVGVSVVVPTYGQSRQLDECLAALGRQSLPARSYEVIVVDDCSPDDTRSVVSRHIEAHPHFRVLRHEVNRGRSAARHTGATAARGAIILFVDGDLVVDARYVEAHLRRHRRNHGERIAVIGNIEYHEDYMRGSNFARYVNSRYLGRRSGIGKWGLNLDNLSANYCGSGIVSLRRDDYFASGGFDERMTRYGWEDLDFGVRVKRLGVRIVFAEEAYVKHLDYASAERMRIKVLEMGRESLGVLVTSNPDAFNRTWYRYLLPQRIPGLSVTSRLLKFSLQAFLSKPVRKMIDAWCLNTDRFSFCYVPPLYKLAQAAWFLEGSRQAATGRGDNALPS